MKRLLSIIRCCEPCTNSKVAGKVLRSLVLIFNILLWFAGCAVLSVAVWLLFINNASTMYYNTFPPMSTALYLLLSAGIVLLVISFIGTCGANTKSEVLLSLSLLAHFLIFVAQIVAIIVLMHQRSTIQNEAKKWYTDVFIGYPVSEKDQKMIDHFQMALECCGLTKPNDFRHRFSNITSLPASCSGETVLRQIRITKPVYSEGCLMKIEGQVRWFILAWPIWFCATILFILELGGFFSGLLFMIYQFRRGKLDYDDDEEDESSGLIDEKDAGTLKRMASLRKQLPLMRELPLPKLYRVVRRTTEDTFGFSVDFDAERKQYVIGHVEPGATAEFAGLKEGSHVIEINGTMTQGATREDVEYKFEFAGCEMRVLVVDRATSDLYKNNKVDINLRNVEGVTDGRSDYRPRLCKVQKSDSGFGFNLLYLEDRKGEFIEDLTPNGSGANAGLKIGDRIVEVNGVNIERENSRDVVRRIRMSGDTVHLLVVDPKTDGYFRKKSVTTTASMAEDYFASYVGAQPETPKPQRKSRREAKPRYCRLLKGSREEFGLYVVIDNKRIGQVIRWVDCGGAADRAGLRIGDRIVEVNGKNVEYEAHQQLIEAICEKENTADLIVVDEDYDTRYKRNKPTLCRIFKENNMFGFCVEYNSSKDGHYVDEVDPQGPADRAGLHVGDRVIQINGSNVDRETSEGVLQRLRECESEVVLLVIDKKSAKHYRQIAKFKATDINEIDFDAISIPEEPVFVSTNKKEDEIQPKPELNLDESVTMIGTKEYGNVTGDTILKGKTSPSDRDGKPRKCILRKDPDEDHGFFLAIDRDRNGQVMRRVVDNGPADRGGLRNGDRILAINNEDVTSKEHDETVAIIRESGDVIEFTVIDERSDDLGARSRDWLFRITREKGGYGFYMWYDEEGHYVQDVAMDSPADKAGLRPGDRLVEINGVNVEGETHEDVFYRIKACTNVVTLMALDAKTFAYCKKNSVELSSKKLATAENKQDDDRRDKQPEKKRVRHEVILRKSRKDDDYGFHLAFSNSFMEGKGTSVGHVVHWVEKGGPADVAGVRDGDRIIEVNGVNVEREDHEQVMMQIHANGMSTVIMVVEYQEDAMLPHDVVINKENGSFGFYLWFDENGHFIEDVTIGSTADFAGLKVGDRLIKVNNVDIESDNHETAVERVRDSGDVVTLNVISVKSTEVPQEQAATKVCNIMKKFGSYGFCIQEDAQGLYVEFVQPKSAAEDAGLHAGDRIMEINGEPAKGIRHTEAIGLIMRSRTSVSLTVLSAKTDARTLKYDSQSRGLKLQHDSAAAIFDQLLGNTDFDYVVEKREYGKAEESHEDQQLGTDMRSADESEMPDRMPATTIRTSIRKRNSKRRKSLRKKLKPSFNKTKASFRKTRFSKGEDNVAFADEGPETSMPDITFKDGQYLEETLKRVQKSATARRRTISRRPKVPTLQTQDKKNGTNSTDRRKPRNFHLATSGTLRWKFEETDSRRPGHVVTRTVHGDLDEIFRFSASGSHQTTLNAMVHEAEDGTGDADKTQLENSEHDFSSPQSQV